MPDRNGSDTEAGTEWVDREPEWKPPAPGIGRKRSFPPLGQSTMSEEERERRERMPDEDGTEAGTLEDWGPTEVSIPPTGHGSDR